MEVISESVPQFVIDLRDSSQAGEARRAAVACAERLGFDETDRGTIAIAATEMATNVLKHAKQGQIVCQSLGNNGTGGVRLIALDGGPGIRNLQAALEDGYSTAGTAGTGLGAVRRLSSHFDIYTLPERGTCVLADFWPRRRARSEQVPIELGVVSLPLRGESECGDGWTVKAMPNGITLMLVDGLGHGAFAAEAAREAVRIVQESCSTSPAALLNDCHDALKKTRGAAVAIANIDQEKQLVSYCGLGNISAALLTPERSRGLASHNGIVGHQMHRIQEFTVPWSQNAALVMHSDGLATRWNLNEYPGISTRDAGTIAAVLYRDFQRERDDTTVMVAKNCICR